MHQTTHQQSRSPRKASVDLNQFQRSDVIERQQSRFKKIVHKNPKIHHDMVKQLKTKIYDEGQDLDDLYSQNS